MTFLESFLRPSYTINELNEQGTFSVGWEMTALPFSALPTGIVLLLTGLSLVFGRGRLARWLENLVLLRNRWFWAASGSFLALTGVVMMVSVIPNPPVTKWQVSAEGLRLDFSDEQRFAIKWNELQNASWDTSRLPINRAPLVLTYGDEKRVWLALDWLLPRDRYKFLKAMALRAPQIFQPVIEDRAFQKFLLSTYSRNE